MMKSLRIWALIGLCWALPAQAAAPAAVEQSYQQVELARLVESSRTPVAGQKIVIRPSPVSFSATLLQMPVPQRSDYLRQVLGMMQTARVPTVEQRVVLGYGDNKGMPAYIEQVAARRLAAEAKAGERRRFYALHVYNYSKGPALVITSFGARE